MLAATLGQLVSELIIRMKETCQTAGEEGWKSATCVLIESMEEKAAYTRGSGDLAGMLAEHETPL
jgi:hypothetical protein